MAWGALAGFGKGVSDYAGILGEQRKNDWKNKQEQLKHERNISLQDLQNTAATERQQAGFTHAETMAAERAGLEETRLEAARTEEEIRYQRRRVEAVEGAKDITLAQGEAKLELEAKQREVKKELIDKTEGLTDSQRRLLKGNVDLGAGFTQMSEGKSKKVDADLVQKEIERISLTHKDLSEDKLSAMAYRSAHIAQHGVPPFKMPGDPTGLKTIKTQEELDKTVKDIKDGVTNLEEAYASLDTSSYEKLVKAIEEEEESEPIPERIKVTTSRPGMYEAPEGGVPGRQIPEAISRFFNPRTREYETVSPAQRMAALQFANK